MIVSFLFSISLLETSLPGAVAGGTVPAFGVVVSTNRAPPPSSLPAAVPARPPLRCTIMLGRTPAVGIVGGVRMAVVVAVGSGDAVVKEMPPRLSPPFTTAVLAAAVPAAQSVIPPLLLPPPPLLSVIPAAFKPAPLRVMPPLLRVMPPPPLEWKLMSCSHGQKKGQLNNSY